MFVLVDDRQKGKTSKLVGWLLEGEAREDYPGWSRVIVCHNRSAVVHTTDMVKRATQEEWNSLTYEHKKASAFAQRLRELSNIRKAVWSLDELRFNTRGARMELFEYAIDNVDFVLSEFLGVYGVYKMPEVIAMTGKAWS